MSGKDAKQLSKKSFRNDGCVVWTTCISTVLFKMIPDNDGWYGVNKILARDASSSNMLPLTDNVRLQDCT